MYLIFSCAHNEWLPSIYQGHDIGIFVMHGLSVRIRITAHEFIKGVTCVMFYLCAYGMTPLSSSRVSLARLSSSRALLGSCLTCVHMERRPWIHQGRHLSHDLPVRIRNDAPEFIKGVTWSMIYLCAYGMTPLSSSRASLWSCFTCVHKEWRPWVHQGRHWDRAFGASLWRWCWGGRRVAWRRIQSWSRKWMTKRRSLKLPGR